MKTLRVFFIIVIIALLIVGQVIAGEWKQIKIATEGEYPPWNYFDGSGKLVGFEIDLTQDLCRRMDIEYEIVPQKWRTIIKGLTIGKYDAIIASMSITESRKKLVQFSRAYADVPTVFVVRKDHPLTGFQSELKHLSLNDIDPAEQRALDALTQAFKGKLIGVQIATIYAKFADQYLGDQAEIRIYDFQHTVDLELYQGRLDALIGDMPYWLEILNSPQGKDYQIMGPTMTGGPLGDGIGVAVRKEDQGLADMFSTAIAEALHDGTIAKLSAEWFPFDVSAKE
jgi:octopine/nopaline transport system substrate-binding protein